MSLPEVIRMIGIDGTAVGDLPDISKTELLELYRLAALSREFDARCGEMMADGRIGFWAPATATEAVAVGSATALAPEDWIFASPRFPGFALARGVTASELLDGALTGRSDSGPMRPGHRGFVDARLAPQGAPTGVALAEAAGAALGLALAERDALVLACCGDGALETPSFHGALTISECGPCALVIVIEDRTGTGAFAAAGFDTPLIEADGRDMLAVRTAVESAAGTARDEQRPVVVAALVDDDDDPTERLGLFLEQHGDLSTDLAEDIGRAARREIDEAVDDLTSRQNPRSPFDHVVATQDPRRDRQRTAWSRFDGPYGGELDADSAFLLGGETA